MTDLQYGLSIRDEKENDIRYEQQQAELALNELMSLFLYDTTLDTINQPLDSMLVYLLDWNSNSAKEQMVQLYWQKEAYTDAQDLLDELSAISVYETKVALMQKMHDAFSEDLNLDELLPDTNWIDSIALDSTKMGYALARSLMFTLTEKRYPNSYVFPDTSWSRSAKDALMLEEEAILEGIHLYPNPNKGSFTIKGIEHIEDGDNTVEILVFDIMGKEVYKEKRIGSEEIDIELPDGTTGALQLILQTANGRQYTYKLIVNE